MDKKRFQQERERIVFQMNIVQTHIDQGNGNRLKPYTDTEKLALSERKIALEEKKREIDARMKRGY